jgi:outer membrane protein OmpA-like peptidoglycan-associated protein
MFIMSFNLVESVKEVLSGDMTNKIAAIVGDSSANVQQALNGVIPSILTGILLKAESGEVQETLNLATDASRIDIPHNLNSLSAWNGNSRGMDFLKIIFGEKTTELAAALSGYAGISQESVSALMSISAPAALGVLGNHILDTNMNASGLRSFLNGQKRKILNAMPLGLFLEGILGVEDLSSVAEKFRTTDISQAKPRRAARWVWLLITGVIVLAAGLYYYNLQKPSVQNSPPVTDTVKAALDTMAAIATPENPLAIKLPDGSVINAKKGGIEVQLIDFFNDPESKPSRRYPYNFDQVQFNPGTAVITSESMPQIQNVAMILKAYPNAKIKIGGFNEKGGDSAGNRALSESRATSISAALKAAGAGKSQIISVEGFGSDFAKYPEDAPDSLKAKDHRISISIRGK